MHGLETNKALNERACINALRERALAANRPAAVDVCNLALTSGPGTGTWRDALVLHEAEQG